MYSAVITKSGQVTLPKELREYLGLKLGDRVSFRRTKTGATIERKLADEELLGEIRAINRKHGSSSDNLPDATAAVRAFREGKIEKINKEYAKRYGV